MPLSLGIASGAGSLKDRTEPELLGYRVNYISNPSFEVDASGWSAFNNANIATTSSQSNTGSSCLEITNTFESGIELSQRVPFLAGEGNYSVSAYVRLAEGNLEANYYLRYLQYQAEDSTGTVTTGNIGTQSLSYTGNWVRLSGVMPKAGPANYFSIRILTSSFRGSEVYFVDSVMVEKSETADEYFDGSIAGGFWTGTPHSSYSGGTPY